MVANSVIVFAFSNVVPLGSDEENNAGSSKNTMPVLVAMFSEASGKTVPSFSMALRSLRSSPV